MAPNAYGSIPFGTAGLRRSNRHSIGSSAPSGSEYHASDHEHSDDAPPPPEPEEEEDEKIITQSARGRRVVRPSYVESEDDEDEFKDDTGGTDPADLFNMEKTTHGRGRKGKGRATRRTSHEDDDDEHDVRPYGLRTRAAKNLQDFVISDEEDGGGERRRLRPRKESKPPQKSNGHGATNGRVNSALTRAERLARRKAEMERKDETYIDTPTSPGSADADGSFDHVDGELEDLDVDGDADADGEADAEADANEGKPYAFRQRAKINYAIPPPLEEVRPPPKQSKGGGRNKKNKTLGWSATGAELGRWMGMKGPGDDSVRVYTSLSYPTDTLTRTRTSLAEHLANSPLALRALESGVWAPSLVVQV